MSGDFIVNFEHILHLFLVFLLLTLNANVYWDGWNLDTIDIATLMMETFIPASLKGNKQTRKGQYSHPVKTVQLTCLENHFTGLYVMGMLTL